LERDPKGGGKRHTNPTPFPLLLPLPGINKRKKGGVERILFYSPSRGREKHPLTFYGRRGQREENSFLSFYGKRAFVSSS